MQGCLADKGYLCLSVSHGVLSRPRRHPAVGLAHCGPFGMEAPPPFSWKFGEDQLHPQGPGSVPAVEWALWV